MYRYTTHVRVRYGETDQMGYVYYGNYALYYEVGRVETLRSLGATYAELEAQGIQMPVMEMHVQFVKPVRYDDILYIETRIPEMPAARMRFDYDLTNAAGDLVNIGKTTLVFYDPQRRKPTRPPEWMLALLRPYYP
jgi:acyl-CoA thioester hydrolase